MTFGHIFMISFVLLASSLADQSLEARLKSLEIKIEMKDKVWTQKLEDQKQNFEAKLQELKNSCKCKDDPKDFTSLSTFVQHEQFDYIEDRVSKLEEYHDSSFNGKTVII